METPIDGVPGGEVPGTGGVTGFQAQFRDDLKSHEAFTGFKTISEFGDAHLANLGKVAELEGKVANSIPKLSETATLEERQAYYKALGVPNTPAEYEFPKGEGVEHDQKMTDWAKGVFHTANLSADQAGVISQAWDTFIQELVKEQDTASEKEFTEAETAIKAEWGPKYAENLEHSRRFYEKHAKETLGDEKLSPRIARFIFNVSQLVKEDSSLLGGQALGDPPKVGMNYNMPAFK